MNRSEKIEKAMLNLGVIPHTITNDSRRIAAFFPERYNPIIGKHTNDRLTHCWIDNPSKKSIPDIQAEISEFLK